MVRLRWARFAWKRKDGFSFEAIERGAARRLLIQMAVVFAMEVRGPLSPDAA